jgi:hypothetical protein
VELTHLDLNPRFDMNVVFTANYSFSERDLNPRFDMNIVFTANYSFSERRRPRRQRAALGDRLCESRSNQSSLSDVLIEVGCVCVRVFIGVNDRTYIYLYCISKKIN